MERSLFRRIFSLRAFIRLIFAFLILAGGIAAIKWWWDSRVFQGYESTHPLTPKILSQAERDGYHTETVEITGFKGERIPVRIVQPGSSSIGQVPCIVFLYGIGQNAKFFDRVAPIFAARGFAMAMPEQFQCGDRRQQGIGLLREALALRERCSRIVPETRRLVDFLSTLKDIDPDRIYLIGVSYGGITGCSVLAQEPRLKRGAMIMAGGDLGRMFRSMARKRRPESRIVWPAAASIAAWFLAPFEPLDFVRSISPRPLLFLNVRNDELIDLSCVRKLFHAAGEPKEQIWYDGAHNSITEETVRQMLNRALDWMRVAPDES